MTRIIALAKRRLSIWSVALTLVATAAGALAEPATAHKWPHCGHSDKWYWYPGWYYLITYQYHYTVGPGYHYHRYKEYYGVWGQGPSYIFFQHAYDKRC